MKYAGTLRVTEASAFAEFFTETDFGGESGKVPRGKYEGGGEGRPEVKSLKLAPCTRAAFYENGDGSGKSAVFAEDARELTLGFAPALVEIESCVECLKDGKVTGMLPEGEYKPAELKKYDAVRVPRGVYLAFMGCEKDENAVRLFENEEAKIDAQLDDYAKAAVFALPGVDLRLNFKLRQELSDEELGAASGGDDGFSIKPRTFLYWIPVAGQIIYGYDMVQHYKEHGSLATWRW